MRLQVRIRASQVPNKKSFADETSADDKSIGFEYQYYYFLDKLLNLKVGQSVGLEVEDDVHVDFDADYILLFQLKHTVQKNVAGEPIALSGLDSDLWKTVSNWSKTITDDARGRSTSEAQLSFVRKVEFHLVTNKSQSKKNPFLDSIEKLRAGDAKLMDVKAAIKGLSEKTADKKIKGYLDIVLALSDSVAEQFFRRIYVEVSVDDIIARAKSSVLDKFIDVARVDDVFARLDSTIRQDNFIAIKAGSPVLITYENLMQRYRHIFADGRSKKLTIPSFNPVLPENIFSQVFVKRLIEVTALAPDDDEGAVDLTIQKLRIVRYLEAWVQSGDLISDEVDALHRDALLRWKNKFQFAFRKCASTEDVIDKAIELLVELRQERFRVGPSELDTELSNGELYHLSDEGKIGWHRDWESL